MIREEIYRMACLLFLELKCDCAQSLQASRCTGLLITETSSGTRGEGIKKAAGECRRRVL